VVRADLGLGRRLERAWVGGELGLEPADLAAQLAAGVALVGVAAYVGQRGGGDGVKRDRELARLDALGAGLRERLGDEVAQLGRDRRIVRHEGAGPLAGNRQTVLLEAAVDRADGVDVDADPLGELAHARKPLPGLRLAGADEGAKLPEELRADGELAGRVDGEPLGDQKLRRSLEIRSQRLRRGRRGQTLLCH
jgi:hypothetical protein